MNLTPSEEATPLTPQAFHILLALAEKPMYGYGIIQQCEVDSSNNIYFDKGGMYRALKRLVSWGFIEPTFETYGSGSVYSRRYYALTSSGEQVLQMECDRYRQASILGHHRLNQLRKHAEAISL